MTFADENLKKIEKLEIDLNDEYNSFFLGMIIRQHTINNDFSILFETDRSRELTSKYILYRCLIDDFIQIVFISNEEDKYEMVTKLNADALNKNFKKLMDLAQLNEEKLNGDYPFYPTYDQMEEVKQKMIDSPKRQHHFSDKDNFKFKTYKATGNIIRELKDEEEHLHQLRRAYFIWRKYSDYVHYSNLTFEEEQTVDPDKDSTYTEFAEIISYSYFTILKCLNHFEENYEFEITDSNNLAEYYKNSVHR
ncbi:hypothetical protein [Gillisia sp. Hel1_33_143]|uniref:hypothetical protein n=1 Tax=Gillisia sp. Hel1_33_143 TaxID=1336796 RepID=UPI00155F9EDF|nr:hypothetical protein [Gillisia sp. Hel1_33_143]